MITYQQYQETPSLHKEFFRQFVTPEVTATVLKFIGKDKVLASKDPHLNDVPLALWDRVTGYYNRDGGFFSINRKTWEEAGCNIIYYTHKVCVAKEAALMWKEEMQR